MPAALLFNLAGARRAYAHAFGVRYDLPLPLELYLLGAGSAVGLSFLLLALFMTKGRAEPDVPRLALWRPSPSRNSLVAAAQTVLEGIAVALFVLIITAGLFGSSDPAENFAPVMVWLVWWVGLAFVSALLGDLWRLINPWNILFRWGEALLSRVAPGRPLAGRISYPEWLGVWPAVLLFLMFAWLELLWAGRSDPAALAKVVLVYSAVTWTGMFLFGRKVWLERGEVFTLVFSIFARFAPLELAREGPQPGLYLRPYALGLLTKRPVSASLTVLVLLLLSTVAFDGFVETPAWFKIVDWTMLSDSLRHLLAALELPPRDLIVAIKSVVLVVFPLLFVAVYLVFCLLTKLLAGAPGRLEGGLGWPLGGIAGGFVLTLVPIAIAYHMAHYLLFLLQTGQMIIPLASDPFGFGWDLFGTAAYRASIDVMNARLAWYLALGAIVLGHVLAVYLAHVTALRLYETPRAALLSQVPMVALMIGYTMVSLWILSQPIVA